MRGGQAEGVWSACREDPPTEGLPRRLCLRGKRRSDGALQTAGVQARQRISAVRDDERREGRRSKAARPTVRVCGRPPKGGSSPTHFVLRVFRHSCAQGDSSSPSSLCSSPSDGAASHHSAASSSSQKVYRLFGNPQQRAGRGPAPRAPDIQQYPPSGGYCCFRGKSRRGGSAPARIN